MRTYQLQLAYTPGSSTADLLPGLKPVAFFAVYGQNLNMNYANADGITTITMTADFNINLENVKPTSNSNNVFFNEIVQDTKVTSIIENIDRPYPKKGLYVVTIERGQQLSTKDLDHFKKIDIGGTFIFFGILNSSQTDFYTPLSGVEEKIFLDLKASGQANIKATFGNGANRLRSGNSLV